MKIIKGDLILTKDTTFSESIKVKGDIKGYYNLKVAGNIDAWDINAMDIDARNINAWNIDAGNIDAWNINAGDIDARNIDAWNINAGDINARNIDARNIDAGNINALDIICEKRIKKLKTSKTICRVYVKNKYSLVRQEVGDKLI